PKAEQRNDKLSVGYIPGPNGTQHQSNTVYHTETVSPSLNATDYKNPIKVTVENEDTEPKAERIGGIFDKDGERHQVGAVWDKEQLAPTLDTMQGGWRQPSVLEGVDVHPFSKKLEFQDYKQKEISPCLLATDYKAPKTILESIPIKNN